MVVISSCHTGPSQLVRLEGRINAAKYTETAFILLSSQCAHKLTQTGAKSYFSLSGKAKEQDICEPHRTSVKRPEDASSLMFTYPV